MVAFIRRARNWTACTAALLLGLAVFPASAVIEALTSLDKFAADADLILVASVKQLDLEKGRLVLAAESRMKGEGSTATLSVRLAGNADGALAGVSTGDTVVLFVSRGPQQDLAYGYAGGAWFQLIGTHDQEAVRWQFKAGEPYLRRTYSDETTKLVEILTAHIAGTSGLPAPDATIPAGYGLIPGKHPAPSQPRSPKLPAPTAIAKGEKHSAFPINVPLTIAAAGCGLAFLFMLTRSQPLEAADG